MKVAQFLQTKLGQKLRVVIGIILFIIAFAFSGSSGVMRSIAIFIGIGGLLFSFSGALGICLIAPLIGSSITGPESKVVSINETQKLITVNKEKKGSEATTEENEPSTK